MKVKSFKGDELRKYLLCLTIACLLQHVSGECPECTNEDLNIIQGDCRESGAQLEEAETTGNSTLVCSRLHNMFECVAKNVPQCMGTINEQYQRYEMTPWDCHISHDQLLAIQKLVNTGCGESVYDVVLNDQSEGIQVAEVYSNEPNNTCATVHNKINLLFLFAPTILLR